MDGTNNPDLPVTSILIAQWFFCPGKHPLAKTYLFGSSNRQRKIPAFISR
jgi:hypothetical protein